MSSALVYGQPREQVVARLREELKSARRGSAVAQNRAITLLLGIVVSDGKRIAELEARGK